MQTAYQLQDLAPKWAHFCLNIEAYFKKLGVQLQNSSMLVACSGGSDSLALLYILHFLASRHNFRIHIAHLDHCLRAESTQDRNFVHDIAQKLAYPFYAEKIDVKIFAQDNSMGLEEAARICRYKFLEKIRLKTTSSWIVLAHHLDDLMEDVLLRLIRGTGWPALAGMQAIDTNRHLVRPLLKIHKHRLQTFLQSMNIEWREDLSNTSHEFTRNRIRQSIIPQFLQENPKFGQAVLRLHTQAEYDDKYFSAQFLKLPVQQTQNSISIARTELLQVSPAIRLRFYKNILDKLGPGQVLTDTLLALDAAVSQTPAPRSLCFQFPGGKNAVLYNKILVFSLNNTKENSKY